MRSTKVLYKTDWQYVNDINRDWSILNANLIIC